jgi:hypothetical protein
VNGKTADDTNLNERAGYVETKTDADSSTENVYYVFPGYFKNIVAKGLNLKATAKMLIDEGILEPENDKYFQKRVYLNGKRQRMYLINSKIFRDNEND